MAQILNTISEEEVDIMFLLETDKEEKNIASVTLPGFITVPGKPSIHDGKVRIMAFVSENLPFSHRKDLSSADTSTLWLEIERENKANYLIGGCYREWGSADLSSPKNISEDHQLARLQNITKTLQTATSEKKDLVFLGDINFDMKKWNQMRYKWKNISDAWRTAIAEINLNFADLGITYIHPSGKIKSAIDHIYFNSNKVDNCRKLEISMSDHYPICVDLSMQKQKPRDTFVLKRCFKNFKKAAFLNDLAQQPDWQSLSDPSLNVHQKAEIFNLTFESTFNRHAKLKRIKVYQNYKRGLSASTKSLIRKRNRCHGRSHLTVTSRYPSAPLSDIA